MSTSALCLLSSFFPFQLGARAVHIDLVQALHVSGSEVTKSAVTLVVRVVVVAVQLCHEASARKWHAQLQFCLTFHGGKSETS